METRAAVLHDSKMSHSRAIWACAVCSLHNCTQWAWWGWGGVYAWTVVSVATVGKRMGRDQHRTQKIILGTFVGVLSSA